MTRPVPQRTPSGSRIVARARRHLPAVLCMVAGGAWAVSPGGVGSSREGVSFWTVSSLINPASQSIVFSTRFNSAP